MIQGVTSDTLGEAKFVASGADLDEGDTNDDDNDDDDDSASAAEDKADEKSEEKAAKELKLAQEGALEAAQQKKRHAEKAIDDFKDDRSFDNEVAAEVKVISNETQSESLSNFLGIMRTELRLYNKPTYPAYLESKLAVAEKRVQELEKKLGKEPKVKPVKEKSAPKEKVEKSPKPEAKKESPEAEKVVADTPSASKEAEKKASETWAVSFFANIALMAVVFGMANAKHALVRKYTWFLIDQVIVIFLAVVYFQAFDSILDYADLPSRYHVLTSVMHAVVMLAMVLALAFRLRRNDLSLSILCAAGAHVVSFSSIHGAATVQNQVWIDYSYSWLMCIWGMAVLGLGLAMIGYLVYTAKRNAGLLDDDSFMDKTDDLENDFGAMAFSVVFSMFVRFMITGHHPVDDESGYNHTEQDRLYMLLWACTCLIISSVLVAQFTKQAEEAADSKNYAKKRLWNFLTTVSSMSVAWAFLYWGEWEFFGNLYAGEAVKGRVMFAIVSTLLGGLMLLGLAMLHRGEPAKAPLALVPSREAVSKNAQMVAVTAISLIVAWSWELTFDQAVEDMTAGVQHPAGWKFGSALALFAIVIPVYATYVKPAVKRNGNE